MIENSIILIVLELKLRYEDDEDDEDELKCMNEISTDKHLMV
jgi:hypothetical protein